MVENAMVMPALNRTLVGCAAPSRATLSNTCGTFAPMAYSGMGSAPVGRMPDTRRSKEGQNVPLRPTLERPIESPVRTARFGSDVVAHTLRALDIPYIALNPGASFRGLHDS